MPAHATVSQRPVLAPRGAPAGASVDLGRLGMPGVAKPTERPVTSVPVSQFTGAIEKRIVAEALKRQASLNGAHPSRLTAVAFNHFIASNDASSVRAQFPAEVARMRRAFSPQLEQPLQTHQQVFKAGGMTLQLDYTNVFKAPRPGAWTGTWGASTTPALARTTVDLSVAARPGTQLRFEVERFQSWREGGRVKTQVMKPGDRTERTVKVDASGRVALGDVVTALGAANDVGQLRVRVTTVSERTGKPTGMATFTLPPLGMDR